MAAYYSLSSYFKKHYGVPIRKIIISLPFSCPHGRCSYCLDGSAPFKNSFKIPFEEQAENGILNAKKKYGANTKYLIYFQTYTNTNAPVDELKKLYDAALKYENVIGISVGTRPDCAGEDVLELLGSYVKKGVEVWAEYGLQSADNNTLKRINRGHTAEMWKDAVLRSKKKGIKAVAHVIAGLPGETVRDFVNTAVYASDAGIFGIKIHPLYVQAGTPLGEEYKKGLFKVLGLNEYISALAEMLEVIPKDVVVMRFTAEGREDTLLAPEYCAFGYKIKIKEMLVKELARRGTEQGIKNWGQTSK